MSTYEIARDGIADLALPVDLDGTLVAALDGDNGTGIRWEIDERVSAEIDAHGGINADGTWPGEWSASDIVCDVLSQYGGRI